MRAALLRERQTQYSIENRKPLNVLLSEFSPDNNLLKEVEQHGSQWLIAIYTDKLKSWKETWKSSRFGEGKNQAVNAQPRTSEDIIRTEGSIVQTPTLSKILESKTIFPKLPGPMNSDVDVENLMIYSPCSQSVVVGNIKEGLIEKRLTHPLFNDLHSISLNSQRESILVVSSGADMVIELDHSGDILWKWNATDFASKHGLINTSTLDRRREMIDVRDFRKWVIPTSAQTTHINTATWLNENQIGITLFHQGMALVVNRKTDRVQIVKEGLIKPHGFQPTEDEKFIVTNTGGGEILVLDEKFKTTETISGFFDTHPANEISWIHTSFPVNGKIIAIDQTLGELIILDPDSKRIQRIKHSDDWKISFIARV